jgi:DNA repair exonuclease SbcCD nuclease subunit
MEKLYNKYYKKLSAVASEKAFKDKLSDTSERYKIVTEIEKITNDIIKLENELSTKIHHRELLEISKTIEIKKKIKNELLIELKKYPETPNREYEPLSRRIQEYSLERNVKSSTEPIPQNRHINDYIRKTYVKLPSLK